MKHGDTYQEEEYFRCDVILIPVRYIMPESGFLAEMSTITFNLQI